MPEKPSVFMITPFEESFLDLYTVLKNRYIELYEFSNAGDLDNSQQSILKDIVQGISRADVIIADLTGLNANVFYELGLAHAMNKKVIILTQDLDELPFDIRTYRANEYSITFNQIPSLYTKLDELLAGAIDCSIPFGNPVSDFSIRVSSVLPVIATPQIATDLTSAIQVSNDNGEKEDDSDIGLWDLVDNINNAMSSITNELSNMVDELNQMTSEVKQSASKIEHARKTGGSGFAAYVRNTSRDLSRPISTFASQLQSHVDIISKQWNNTENNYLLLLNNVHIFTLDNMKYIEVSKDQLSTLKSTIKDTDVSIDDYRRSLTYIMGYEKMLTRASKNLDDTLHNYLITTDNISSSINRIIEKSEIVLLKKPDS